MSAVSHAVAPGFGPGLAQWIVAGSLLIACSTVAAPSQRTLPERSAAADAPRAAAAAGPIAVDSRTAEVGANAGEPLVAAAPSPNTAVRASTAKTSELGEAAFTGDLPRVRALLKTTLDLNARSSGDVTPLMLALDAPVGEPGGCDAKSHCQAGSPSKAARAQRDVRKAQIARELIARGADVQATDALGFSALHHAVMSESNDKDVVNIMELLIGRGARVDLADPKYGRTPLELAVERGAARVECLLRHGADARKTTREGKSLLEVAEQRGDARVVKLLKDATQKGGSDGS